MSSKMAWFAVAMTILFTVYGQIAVRMRAMNVTLPAGGEAKIWSVLTMLFDPWIASGLAAAFVAALFWLAAMTKLPLSTAYPFVSLTFVIVAVLGAFIFHEPINGARFGGIALVMAGLVLIARA